MLLTYPMEQSKHFQTVKMLFLPLSFLCYKKTCHKVNPSSQAQWREHRHSLTVVTLHIILQDLCEHQEQSLLKAPHCLWVCLARYPYRQADWLKQVMVKVRFAGILETSYKQINQSKLAHRSLILLNIFFYFNWRLKQHLGLRILVTYLLICLWN